MPSIDRSELKKLVQDLRTESVDHNKQWMKWLGIASGSAIALFLTFATKLSNPDYALKALLPSLSALVCGVCFAGLAVLTAALRVGALQEHYGAAFTRDEYNDAILSIPLVISSPRSLADESNKERNFLIKERDKQHIISETAWKRFSIWKFLNRLCLFLSSTSLFIGISEPLFHIYMGYTYVPVQN